MNNVSFLDFVKDIGGRGTGINVVQRKGTASRRGQLFCNTATADKQLVLAINGSIEFIRVQEVSLVSNWPDVPPRSGDMWYMTTEDFSLWERYQVKAGGEKIVRSAAVSDLAKMIPITRIRYTGDLVEYRGHTIVGMFLFTHAGGKLGNIPEWGCGFLITDKGTPLFVDSWDVKRWNNKSNTAVHLVD